MICDRGSATCKMPNPSTLLKGSCTENGQDKYQRFESLEPRFFFFLSLLLCFFFFFTPSFLRDL